MTFPKRHRGLLIIAAVLAIVAGSEVALEMYYQGEALVQVENLGAEPVDPLVLIHGGVRVVVPKLAPGATSKIYLSGKGEKTLRFEFRQRGNAMTSYDLPGFDAAGMHQDGFKLCIRLKSNEVERFQEDSEPATPLGRFAARLWKRFIDHIEAEYKAADGRP